MKKLNELIDENTLIWSDLHLGHKNILKFEEIRKTLLDENSSQDLLTQHDNYFINTGNEIAKNNVLLNLGDFAHNNASEYSKRCKGTHILLKGNHDKNHRGLFEQAGIRVIDQAIVSVNNKEYIMSEQVDKLLACYITKIKGVTILFSHFPIFDENPYDIKFKPITSILEELFYDFNCDINIHGHTHSKAAASHMCYNVSVESINFKPKTIKEILEEKI